MGENPDSSSDNIPISWLGYPLWYHENRYLKECLDGFKIVGSNYLTWWSIDYAGNDALEKLFNAYNYTFLNLLQKNRDERLSNLIKSS